MKPLLPLLLLVSLLTSCINSPQIKTAPVPVIDGDFWRIGHAPDLDSLNGDDLSRQHVVDHGFVKDEEDNWHLWACMRGTRAGRIFYGWTGQSLDDQVVWEQNGVVARADREWGERDTPGREQMQAPYFLKMDDTYYCFYNSAGIRIMTSTDGKNYERPRFKENGNLLYDRGGRDVMVMVDDSVYYAYSTISTVARDDWLRGFVSLRTSTDLKRWSDYTVVSEGGRAGNGAVSAESPFVLKYGEYYFLFRSSSSSGSTYVYRSRDPYNFGVNNDEYLVAELPIWAPEIILENEQWYISDIADFQGVMLAKLRWEERALHR